MKIINVKIDEEINNIVTQASKRIGTSKRNIFSFAIIYIRDNSHMFSCTDIFNMQNTMSLDYQTTISISDDVGDYLKGMTKENTCYLGKNRYFGILINHFFTKYRHEFINEDKKKY